MRNRRGTVLAPYAGVAAGGRALHVSITSDGGAPPRDADRRSMPISYRIDRPVRLIRSTVEGDFTAAEMLACVSEAVHEAGERGYQIVSDHRLIGEPATRDQVELLVEHLTDLRRFVRDARWAVVVSKPASFGMMRMFAVLAERVPLTVRVFTDAEEAEQWARTGDVEEPAHD